MKTVLITGASARIGAHIAKGLAADGWGVVIHYNRGRERAEVLTEQINTDIGKAASIHANMNIPSDVASLIDRAADAIGSPLTALINNASTFDPDTAGDFTHALFDHHMDANLRAPLLLTQHFTRALPDDQTGCVINMIDQRVLAPSPGYFTYAVSKAGLYWATKTLAQSFAPRVRVNGIGPGPTLQNKNQTEDEFEAEKQSTLLGEGSPPDTILDAVRYLLGAEAVTGQMIAVDGGQHLSKGSRL